MTGGAGLEGRLLAKLLTPEGIAEVTEADLRPEVFEEPIYGAAFTFVLDYWRNGNKTKAPTRRVLEEEFPSVAARLPEPDEVEELTSYLIWKLKRRYRFNRGQHMVVKAAADLMDDPENALQELHSAVREILEVAPDQTHLRHRLISSVEELRAVRPLEPLIDGLLFRNSLAQLAGLPGSLKSFLAVGVACALAMGRDLGPFEVPRPGTVLYVAAEGAEGLTTRILAWCGVHKADPDELFKRLRILPLPIQLDKDSVDVSQAIELVTEAQFDLAVLDTRARCTVGLDENNATAQGQAIEAAERIRRAGECTVWALHHMPRTGNAGRGSNAWDGAVWSDLRMERDGLLAKVHCEKHKDAPDGCDHHFSFVAHTVSENLLPGVDERRRSTLVLSGAGISVGIGSLLAPSLRTVLEIIRNFAPPEGLTKTEIVKFAAKENVSSSSAYSAITQLLKDGLIRNVGTEKRHRYVAVAGDDATSQPEHDPGFPGFQSDSSSDSGDVQNSSNPGGRSPRKDWKSESGLAPEEEINDDPVLDTSLGNPFKNPHNTDESSGDDEPDHAPPGPGPDTVTPTRCSICQDGPAQMNGLCDKCVAAGLAEDLAQGDEQLAQASGNGQTRPPNPHDPRFTRTDPARKHPGRRARRKAKR